MFYKHILPITLLVINFSGHLFGEQDAFELYAQSKKGMLSSFSNLTLWAGYERQFHELFLTTWVPECDKDHKCSDKLENLYNYIQDYESSTLQHLDGLKDGQKEPILGTKLDEYAASSLILVYRMTNRFVKYGEALRDFVSINWGKINPLSCSNTTQFLFNEDWPGELEHEIVIYILLSTYKVHDLFVDPDLFLSELGFDSQTPARLTAELAYAVSKTAFEKRDYVQAFDWINYALMLNDWGDVSISKSFLLKRKENMIYMHNIDRQIEDPENNVGYYTRNIAIQDANTESEKYWIRRKQALAHHFRGRISPEFGDINMWTLCTKENTQSESKKAKLKCYLDNQRHPRFYLKPLRVEVLSETPRVLQFHDIIGDKFVSRITEDLDASSKIMSGVGDLKVNDSIKASDYVKLAIFSRSSVNAWFDDDFYPELTRISETVTGLVTSTRLKNSSENFQAVEYAVGRSYTLHVDVPTAHTPESFEDEENRGGARTATLLYYLNDVPKGGHTAFLNAEVAVPPKKGSAVYWENFFRNGTTRVDTWHASCPVLYGRKLVINKWFRSHLQFRTSPCSLNQLE